MTQGEFLAGMSAGGEFENQHAKAFIVFVYHVWDDYYRSRIARALGLKKQFVWCSLMGNLRRVRNAVIHGSSIVNEHLVSQLAILTHIWDLRPGELRLDDSMLYSMMEQLNALRVVVR